MKRKFLMLAVQLFIATVSLAQNPDFRVEKITETIYNFTTVNFEKKLDYVDNKLSVMTITDGGKNYDLLTYTYKKENITVNSKRREAVLNTYTFKEGIPVTYKSNKANTYYFTYEGGRISMVRHEDACNKLDYSYQFNYDEKGKISFVNLLNKAAGIKPISVYYFFYGEDGNLQRMDQTSNGGKLVYRSYGLEYVDDRVSQVSVAFHGKPETRIEFKYDPDGNLVEQVEFDVKGAEPVKRRTIEVTYAKAKGNDSVVWNVYNWEFNLLLGTRTYIELENPCY